MRRVRLVALASAVLVVALFVATAASRPALAVGSQIRTFVASTGSDANPAAAHRPAAPSARHSPRPPRVARSSRSIAAATAR